MAEEQGGFCHKAGVSQKGKLVNVHDMVKTGAVFTMTDQVRPNGAQMDIIPPSLQEENMNQIYHDPIFPVNGW